MFETQTLAILMLVAFFALLMIGVPVAITLATVGFVFGWLGFGDTLFNLLPARVFGVVAGYQWMSIPLFVFMGVMLEKSRLADDLLDVMGHLAGGVRGGMGVGIILFGVLMGATTGIVGATVITLGLLTLPTLIRRGYDKGIACGAICASGTLGQIIPPSLILILLSDIMQLSVGTLFAAAVGPGMLLAGVYIVYLLIRGWMSPHLMPALPADERSQVSRRELTIRFWKVVVPPDRRPKKKMNSYNIENIFSTTLRDTGEVALIDGDTKQIISIVKTGYAVHISRTSASDQQAWAMPG
jgi:tripartite ATP-independent transporter DctM subunit